MSHRLRWRLPIALAVGTGTLWAQGFAGPSILSRGSRPMGRAAGKPIRLRGFLAAGAGYMTGLTGPVTDMEGSLPNEDRTIWYGNAGLYGSRSGVKDQVQANYSIGFSQVLGNNYYSSLMQSLSLDYTRQLSRRWSWQAGVQGNQRNRVLDSTGPSLGSPGLNYAVSSDLEILDNQMFSVAATTGASYRATSRLTTSMSGQTFTARRRSTALASGFGYGFQGELSYALSRRQGIGAEYSYQVMEYARGFGNVHSMQWGGNFYRSLSPRWSFGLSTGLYRIESERLQVFPVDPIVAAITGRRREVGRFHAITYGPSGSANLSGSFRNSGVNFTYMRGLRPGNGLMLAGVGESAGATYDYTGIRHWNFHATARFNRFKTQLPLVEELNRTKNYGVQAGASRELGRSLHLTMDIGVMRTELARRLFTRDRLMMRVGLAFSPGEVPLLFW